LTTIASYSLPLEGRVGVGVKEEILHFPCYSASLKDRANVVDWVNRGVV